MPEPAFTLPGIRVHLPRNRCSRSPESVFTMLWNGCSPSAGICVHDAPEYAIHKDPKPGAYAVSGAQRLSATLMDSPSIFPISSARAKCSTPFGDIDGFTEYSRSGILTGFACSTPFGDIDGFTMIHTTGSNIGEVCSTPFGDIDGFTHRALDCQQRRCDVLNAFRRH